MIPWITLGVTLASLAVVLFLAWVIAGPAKEEDTFAVGFHYTPPQEEEDPEDGC